MGFVRFDFPATIPSTLFARELKFDLWSLGWLTEQELIYTIGYFYFSASLQVIDELAKLLNSSMLILCYDC